MAKFSWQISSLSKKSNARTGYITTPNGVIKTPAFIFCATKAALKSITTTDAKKMWYSNYFIKYFSFNASTRFKNYS